MQDSLEIFRLGIGKLAIVPIPPTGIKEDTLKSIEEAGLCPCSPDIIGELLDLEKGKARVPDRSFFYCLSTTGQEASASYQCIASDGGKFRNLGTRMLMGYNDWLLVTTEC